MFDHLAACRKQDLLSYSSTAARLTLSSGVIRNENPAQKGTIMNPKRYRVIPVSMAIGMGVAWMRGDARGLAQTQNLAATGEDDGRVPEGRRIPAWSRVRSQHAENTINMPCA